MSEEENDQEDRQYTICDSQLQEMLAQARREQREVDAKIADDVAASCYDFPPSMGTAEHIAGKIRARGDKP